MTRRSPIIAATMSGWAASGEWDMISISIVSHGQLDFVERLLQSLEACHPQVSMEIFVTENRDHRRVTFAPRTALEVAYNVNSRPHGLASNINAAFRLAKGEFFCILNPDVVFVEEVFASLVQRLGSGADIAAPTIVDGSGVTQESARKVPHPLALVRRRLIGSRHVGAAPRAIAPDWIAGTFLLLRTETFRRLGGMDERFRLYFEDVDLGCRATLMGMRLQVDPDVRVVHEARRASARQPAYLAQHVASAVRFFASPVYRDIERAHHRDR